MNHPGPPPPAMPGPYPQQGRPGGYGPPPGAYGPPPGRPGGGYGPPPPPPMGPPYGPPPPPPKKSSAGKIVAIVVAVLLVLLAAGAFAAYKLVSGVASTVTGSADGGSGCGAVSTADVNAVLGGQWDVVQLGGLGGIAGGVLDSRVLPDAPSCWAVQNGEGKLARIARYQGADAAQRFADEKRKARGASEDKGNGITVSTSAYLGPDVQAGDEGFCTTGDMTAAAGALVRTGNTLVYVSTTAAGQGASSVPDIDVTGSSSGQVRFGTDKANCDLAVKLIATMR